jgi:hypothetical protein
MFRSRKTKIVSTPVEEILEVEVPFINEEPVAQTVANIEFLSITSQDDETSVGTLTDYDDNVYYYAWDFKSKRIIRLTGERLDSLTWSLCDQVLQKYYNRPAKPVEEPIGPQIEQAVNKVLAPLTNSVKNVEGKIDKALTVKVAPAPAPVQAQTTPRPQSVQSAPIDAPAVNVADNDISTNALRFLQDSNVDDLGIDYMSL